jgi:hypothetical protein
MNLFQSRNSVRLQQQFLIEELGPGSEGFIRKLFH